MLIMSRPKQILIGLAYWLPFTLFASGMSSTITLCLKGRFHYDFLLIILTLVLIVMLGHRSKTGTKLLKLKRKYDFILFMIVSSILQFTLWSWVATKLMK